MERLKEIEARMAQIRTEMDQENADIDALTNEVRALKEEKKQLEDKMEQRKQLRQEVEAGAGQTVRTFADKKEAVFGVDSEEYRTAWLKNLQGATMSPEEKRAFTAANGAVSKLVVNDIMSVVRDHAPLLERVSVIYSASKITYYIEGTNNAASDHTENAAITPAADTLTSVDLSPAEIVKMIQVSEAAQQMSIPVFNAWLTRTIGEAIARTINGKIITAISTAVTTATANTITAANVQALLGAVKGESVAILCNRKTLYTALLPLQDNSKNSLVRFEGPGGTATVYGVEVLVDDNVADSTVLAGDMKKAIAAMGEDITVRQAYDINTNSYKYLGVALFDTKIGIASAFAKLAPAAGGGG